MRRLMLCGMLMIGCASGPRPAPTPGPERGPGIQTADRAARADDPLAAPTLVTAWMEEVTGPGQSRPVRQGEQLRLGRSLVIQVRLDQPGYVYLGTPGKDGRVARLSPPAGRKEVLLPRIGQVPEVGQVIRLEDPGLEVLYLVAAARPLSAAELAQVRPSPLVEVPAEADGDGTRGEGGQDKKQDAGKESERKVPPPQRPVSADKRGGGAPKEALAARVDDRGVAVIPFQVNVSQ